MTKCKLCGLMCKEDIEIANVLRPEFIGMVFAPKSKRAVTIEKARELKAELNPAIKAVGVFVDEQEETVRGLLEKGIIDIAQLHGKEDEEMIRRLQVATKKPIIKAFQIRTREDVEVAKRSGADAILLDAGQGSGQVYDWSLLQGMERPYFLAGGLQLKNVGEAIRTLHPYAVDVSSGIETDGKKDAEKMRAFVKAVREV